MDDDGQLTQLSKRDILAMTCNLVVEDTELGIFRYAHTSVLEYLEISPEFNASQVKGLLLARCMDALLQHPFTPEHSDCPNHLGVCPESSLQDYASTFWLLHCVSCRHQDRQRSVSFKIENFLYNGFQKAKALADWENRMRYWRQCGHGDVVEWIVSLLYRESRRGLHNPTHWYLTCVLGLTEIIQPMSLTAINSLNMNLRFCAADGKLNLELSLTRGLGMNGLHMAIKPRMRRLSKFSYARVSASHSARTIMRHA